MSKTILLTGATDGIGLATAQRLVSEGHRVLLHGRSPDKLQRVQRALSGGPLTPQPFLADLSDLAAVEALARSVASQVGQLDVIINNAGVYKTAHPRTDSGQDLRFVVNTLAPALLTRRLLPSLASSARIVNLSSAAQERVDLEALAGRRSLSEFSAYAQSKLALTMWSMALAEELGADGAVVVAVNPGSLLNTRMVREGFGRARSGVEVGVDVLVRATLSDEFAQSSGRYFDNDRGVFADPHPDALVPARRAAVVAAVEALLPRTS